MYLRYWRVTGKLLVGSHEPHDRPGASAGSAHHSGWPGRAFFVATVGEMLTAAMTPIADLLDHILRVSTLQGNR